MTAIENPPVGKPPRSTNRLIITVIAGAIGTCLLCSFCSFISSAMQSAGLLPTSTPKPLVNSTEIDEKPIDQASLTPLPNQPESATATDAPSSTPEATNTPEPTETPDGRIRAGTHLVGTDIQPGIYRGEAGDGFFDSCYWARLKDFSGDLDAVLANGNAQGPFYVEVKDSDHALETRCALLPLDLVPPTTEFPQTIGPGIYLVGRDIQPGTYKGEAGTDITESCYWARLSNVAGELDAVLANDNATGQFYVQVSQSDFALSVACEVDYTSN